MLSLIAHTPREHRFSATHSAKINSSLSELCSAFFSNSLYNRKSNRSLRNIVAALMILDVCIYNERQSYNGCIHLHRYHALILHIHPFIRSQCPEPRSTAADSIHIDLRNTTDEVNSRSPLQAPFFRDRFSSAKMEQPIMS